MDKKLQEIIGNISYKNYELLKGGSFFTALLLSIINSNDNIIVKGVNYASLCLYLLLSFSGLEKYTQDMITIKSSYGEVLNNYSNLMKEFGLDNPVQISTMHSNMVEDGYLSVNKNFEFERKNVYDYKDISGTNIINGHGVCRHYVAFLTDLLNTMNIEAFNLGVCFPNYGISIELLDNKTGQTREEIYAKVRQYFLDPDDANQIMKVFDEVNRESGKEFIINLFAQKEKSILKRMIGNHAICLAVKDEYSYYLDPTMRRVYAMKPNDSYGLSDENIDDINIRKLVSYLLNGRDMFNKMSHQLKKNYPSEDRERVIEMMNDTTKLYKENRDVCEKFYQDNEESYQGIAHNLSLLNTNIRTRK